MVNMENRGALEAGIRNLLENCGECREGQTLLIVHETEQDGYYDPELAPAVADVADRLGLKTRQFGVPLIPVVEEPPDDLHAAMDNADCTLFFARLGDQIRFRPSSTRSLRVISYALDCKALASPFGTLPFDAFDHLKRLINQAVARAEEIRVTCPNGTDFSGAQLSSDGHTPEDVTIRRFPVSVFSPVAAAGFSGRIVQVGFLVGTGSSYYKPYGCALHAPVTMIIDGNRITEITGDNEAVAAARAHYKCVGERFGIDATFVHSWHAGIHPGCRYKEPAGRHFERWSGAAFGNPRLLHFHTCGASPPGEISLNILDPTVWFDGVAIWEKGRLYPDRLPGGSDLLNSVAGMRSLFANPVLEVGQGELGQLSSE